MKPYLPFLGIFVSDLRVGLDCLRVRLGGDGAAVCSSDESGSGWARFFPFGSGVGSLMTMPGSGFLRLTKYD
jgi:hypothetical protein